MKVITPYAPALLCLVGLLLSLEYKGERRALLWVFRALSMAVIAACAVGWFVAMPQKATVVLNIAAIACNLPLAGMGIAKRK